jgi:hypothetical protein
MPHNSISSISGTKNGVNDTNRILTTALHMRVDGDVVEGLQGEKCIHPIAAVHANINGVENTYYSLSDYINALMERDSKYFETEYNITVPYICSWRKSADGLHVDDDGGRGRLSNLQLGAKVVIDSIEYMVIGIERDWNAWTTKLRLHYADRFAFEEASGLAAECTPIISVLQAPAPSPMYKQPQARAAVAGEDIEEGAYVSMLDDGTVVIAKSIADHFGRLVGVATTSAATGEYVSYQTSGIASCSSWTFTPGRSVYLRGLVAPNLSQTALASKTVDECLFARVGMAVSPTEIKLDEQLEFIFA